MWTTIRTGLLCATAALAAVPLLALGASRAEARPDGFSVRVVAPGAVVVGKPSVIRVTGTIPVQSLRYPYFATVVSIRTSVLGRCPANYWDATQVANATGGGVLVLTSRVVSDGRGRFSIPVGIRPYAPGTARICAYVNDGEMTTLAAGSKRITVRRAR